MFANQFFVSFRENLRTKRFLGGLGTGRICKYVFAEKRKGISVFFLEQKIKLNTLPKATPEGDFFFEQVAFN